MSGQSDIHVCQKVKGRAIHVCTDRFNNFFCCYCQRALTYPQLADRWQERMRETVRLKELEGRKRK